MGLHYQHTEPATTRRTAVALALGFILGGIVTATIVTTWTDAAAIEQAYTTTSNDGDRYTIRRLSDDGSLQFEYNGQRMYLTSTPPYEGE